VGRDVRLGDVLDVFAVVAALGNPGRSAAQLRDARPPLTRPVARGVGFAEDPGRGISFGQSRCEALAAGVLALLDGDPRSPAHRSAALLDALRRSGIDPGRPWLNPPAGS
jgi:hypothetical protein